MVTLGGRITIVHKEIDFIQNDMFAANLSKNPIAICAGATRNLGKM